MMQLLWLKYTTIRRKIRYALFLLLGEHNHKYIMLKTSELDDREIITIRAAMPRLKIMSLESRVKWLKNNVPNGFRRSYRTILSKNVHLLQKFDPE